jgi:hypothetical protein
MALENEMSLTLNRPLDFGTQPTSDQSLRQERKLNITVVFTSVKATLTALQQAAMLAGELDARITLLVPQVVPFPLPLTSPPVLIDFNERRFRVIAERTPIQAAVQVYLCRDRDDVLAGALRPHSLVVIGGRQSWWPTAEKRLARRLRKKGHQVIFTETE